MTVRTIREGWEYSGLDSDTRPSTGLKIGAIFWVKGVGKEEWDGSAWEQISSKGADHGLNDISDVPRAEIIPEVNASPQAKQEFGDASGDIRFLKVTYDVDGNGDDFIASGRLKASYPITKHFYPGEHIILRTDPDSNITRVDIVAIGDTTSGTLAAGELVTDGETEANYRTAMVTFDFSSTDKVRTVAIASTDRYSAAAAPATTANYSMIQVLGASHA